MGMEAEIQAIGPYSKDIAEYLMYPADLYKDTKEGAEIMVWVCSVNTSRASEELAECFCIKPWDFNQHAFTIFHVESIDFARVQGLVDKGGGCPDIGVEVVVRALVSKGFKFIFLPNG